VDECKPLPLLVKLRVKLGGEREGGGVVYAKGAMGMGEWGWDMAGAGGGRCATVVRSYESDRGGARARSTGKRRGALVFLHTAKKYRIAKTFCSRCSTRG